MPDNDKYTSKVFYVLTFGPEYLGNRSFAKWKRRHPWGMSKYANPDGTLTEEGKRRFFPKEPKEKCEELLIHPPEDQIKEVENDEHGK